MENFDTLISDRIFIFYSEI
ncbi:hypothetical protein VCHENC02_2636A, partial [Vibrio harveyi]